jgi:outer membrane protein TolC
VLELGLRFRETVHLQAELDDLEAQLAALTGGRGGAGDPPFPRLIPPLALDAPHNDPA